MTFTSLNRARKRRGKRAGFTLMEMVLVIGLIAVIMGTVVVQFTGVVEENKGPLVKAAIMGKISVRLMTYRNVNGHLPKSLSEIKPSIKKDAWDREYKYKNPGTHNPRSYDLWSMGPDGLSGNADDIGNWGD